MIATHAISPEASLIDANLDHSGTQPAGKCYVGSTSSPSDLSDRFVRDDAGAFDDLVREYQSCVALLVHRLLGWRGGGDVEDVVQDVFLAAFTQRRRFRGEASLSTWLTAITINRCRSRRRRWQLWWQWFQEQGPVEPPIAPGAVSRKLEAAENAEAVRAAVRRLAARDREVVVLRYFEGMTAPEIAGMTGQSKNAVEVRLHRARAKLAEMLGPSTCEE